MSGVMDGAMRMYRCLACGRIWYAGDSHRRCPTAPLDVCWPHLHLLFACLAQVGLAARLEREVPEDYVPDRLGYAVEPPVRR